MTFVEAVTRLKERAGALRAERARIVQTTERELARVDVQIAAIDNVVTNLKDANQAVVVDTLLTALTAAGLRLEIADR